VGKWALLAKPEKLVLKSLSKSVNLSTVTKNNNRVAVKMLIQGIASLKKKAISKNNSARSIHDTAKEALKQSTKMLDNSAKKMNNLNDNLTKTNAKLTTATEKICKATTKKDTAVSREKTVRSNLATKASTQKKVEEELLDAKKESASSKKKVENLIWQLQQADWPSRGDSVEHYPKKKRIKLAAFEERTAISCRNWEKEEQHKTDANQTIWAQFRQWAAEIILLVQRGGAVAAGGVWGIRVYAIIVLAAKAGVSAAVRAGIIGRSILTVTVVRNIIVIVTAAVVQVGREMLVAAAVGAWGGEGNAVAREARAGLGEGITNFAMATAAATVVEGTGASTVMAGAGVAILTITTLEIVAAASIMLVTTPLFLLPRINCENRRNVECPIQTMKVPMQVMRTWQQGHYCIWTKATLSEPFINGGGGPLSKADWPYSMSWAINWAKQRNKEVCVSDNEKIWS
jgi:hypothetical protein